MVRLVMISKASMGQLDASWLSAGINTFEGFNNVSMGVLDTSKTTFTQGRLDFSKATFKQGHLDTRNI